MTLRKLLLPTLALLFLLPTACTEKESNLGIEMQDPLVLYDGTRCSVSLSANTMYDDSLSTIGYSAGIFGNFDDPVFGQVSAIAYSQIMLPNSTGISFSDDAVIDSVIMTLVIDTLRSNTPEASSHSLHIIVNKLAESISPDSLYYSSCQLAESDTCFFDDNVTFVSDSIVMHLNEACYPVLKKNCSMQDFLASTKGIAIKMASGAQALAAINFAATATRITMFYHNGSGEQLTYVFIINADAAHCMSYRHNYAGSVIQPLASHDSLKLDGSQRLYLEPLGGTKLRLSMQAFLDTFCVKHPTAVIHYAELIMPVEDPAAAQRCKRLLAYKCAANGTSTLATDGNFISNPYTYEGFDGYYDAQRQSYRLRVTRHLQELLRCGKDYGTDIYIDARRSSAFNTVLNGTHSANPIHIELIYTE